MTLNEYLSISTVDILSTQDNFVKNINFMFSQVSEDISIDDITVGGRYIDFGYLIHSKILEKLVAGRAVHFQIKSQYGDIPAGIKSIDENFDVLYYTGKGLREIYPNFEQTIEQKENAEFLKNKTDDYLLQNQYLAKIKLSDIQNIY